LLLNLADSLAKLELYDEMANALQQAIKTEPSAIALRAAGARAVQQGVRPIEADVNRGAVKIDPDYYPALNGWASAPERWITSGRKERNRRRAD